MNRILAFSLCVAGLLILLQCWVFLIIAEWVIVDSYAAMKFPQAHPILGFFAELGWTVDGLGGRYVLLGLAVLLCLGFLLSLRTKKPHDNKP